MNDPPRVRFCDLPTPVRSLHGLSDRLWMKDDSHTASLWGGNKPRKLEFVIGDALARGKRAILTFGALGTNHGLATALYARENGLACVLCLVDQPVDDHVRAQLERIGDSGAIVYRTGTFRRTALRMPWLLARHRLPYVLPAGGSSPVGVLGFVAAARELAQQVRAGELPEPSEVWCALGTGGTAAGLLLGLRLEGLQTEIKAVHVNDQLELSEATILKLVRKAAAKLEVEAPADGVEVVHGYLGGGYGHATPAGTAALERARDAEGLKLDPVYTSKTMAALLDRLPSTGGPVLYWHTYNGV
ncbi:MAG: pyridoxal phosphate-dependent deaminase, putative [uncultured Solirubrobacteraceae bacterium]|uniref:Pyridoxal phosphate-dependent deaminase, putative n=1 Tax=uncultured Solirubrobacteraceae bacterium TaxID=1162706 RepID=A0A6J4SU43_9ACTN|nr:MAG: pyridoxal phosphate-dependent deaminase, putative [uncultured Solirubrobacteraceae bacterium]